jgi:hypothetical protein
MGTKKINVIEYPRLYNTVWKGLKAIQADIDAMNTEELKAFQDEILKMQRMPEGERFEMELFDAIIMHVIRLTFQRGEERKREQCATQENVN